MMIKNTKGIKTHLWLGAATAFFFICIFPGLQTPAAALQEIGKFSTATAGGDFPAGWEPLTFKRIPRHTQYTLVKDRNAVVVKAVSKSSASARSNPLHARHIRRFGCRSAQSLLLL